MTTEFYNDVIRCLIKAIDLHEPGEGDHAERVAIMAVATGERLGMPDQDLLHLRWAAALHDVGKFGTDPLLLRKFGSLTGDEVLELQLHARMAVEVLKPLRWLEPALPLIRHHHERWDGAGYPGALSGNDIPLGSRIIAVAETFDVLTFATPYRPPLEEAAAIFEIQRCSGTQFDPMVIEAFLQIQPLIQPIIFR